MVGIVFTTPREASTFVTHYTDGPAPTVEPGTPISVANLTVAVTGTGKINATLATERLLRTHDLDRLVHAGTCVRLSDDLAPNTVFGASFVLEGDRVELDDPTYPRMPLDCPLEVDQEGTLTTQDHTADDADEQSYWERLADARDHTGYAVAYVAAQRGTACHIVKGVTESADDDSDADVHAAEEEIVGVLQQFLEDE